MPNSIPSEYHYGFYKTVVVSGAVEENSQHELTYGCNGASHVTWLSQVYYDKDWKEVVFAEALETTELGPCDKTCGSERFGGAIHPPSVILGQTAQSA